MNSQWEFPRLEVCDRGEATEPDTETQTCSNCLISQCVCASCSVLQLLELICFHLASLPLWHHSCHSYSRCVAFFVLPKHPSDFACIAVKPRDACNMLYKVLWRRTGFFFLFPFFCEDHQGCQLQTQINYNLEDDPVPSDVSCNAAVQTLMFMCAHAPGRASMNPRGSGTVMGIWSCTSNINSQWQPDGSPSASEHVQCNLWSCGPCHLALQRKCDSVPRTVSGCKDKMGGARREKRGYAH